MFAGLDWDGGFRGYLEGRRRMPLVVRWVTDDVGRDDEAVILVESAVCCRWRESEEFISSCRGIEMEQDRVVMKRIARKRGVGAGVANVNGSPLKQPCFSPAQSQDRAWWRLTIAAGTALR